MIKTLEIKFIESGLFYHKSDATFIVVLWKINNELGQFLPKGSWKRLCCYRQVVNDPEHILQTSRLAIKLSLSISLPGNLNTIGLVLSSQFRIYQPEALMSAKDRNFLKHSASVQVAVNQMSDACRKLLLLCCRLVEEQHQVFARAAHLIFARNFRGLF